MDLKPIEPPEGQPTTDSKGRPLRWVEVDGQPVAFTAGMTDAQVIAKMREAQAAKSAPLPAGSPVTPLLTHEQKAAMRETTAQGGGIVEAITGRARRIPGITEIGREAFEAAPYSGLGTGIQRFTQTDQEELARSYLQTMPGSQLLRDPLGNPMIAYPDPQTGEQKIGYVNAPGLSVQDITSTVGLGVAFSRGGRVVPATRESGAALLSRVRGAPQAPAATPVPSKSRAAASEASGALAIGTGIEAGQGLTGGEFTPVNILAETIGGAATPYIASAFGSAFRSASAKAKAGQADPADIRAELMVTADTIGGEQGAAIRQAVAGMDDQFIRDVASKAMVMQTPETQGQMILMEAFKREIPGFQPLRAYVTGDISDYSMLETARRGTAYGLQDEIAAVDRANEAAIEKRMQQFTPNYAQASEAFAAAGYGVKERANALWRSMQDAYAKAEEKQGTFAAEGVGKLVGYMDEAIGTKGLDTTNYPASMAALEQAKRFITKAADNAPAIKPDAPLTERYRGFNPMAEGRQIGEYVLLRRNLNALYQGAKGDDRIVLTDMVRALDKWADDMEASAYYAGDEGAIQAFRDANALRREYGVKFGEKAERFRTGERKPDIAGRVLRDPAERDDMDGQAVGNAIVAGVNTGNMKQSASTLDRLAKVTGRDTPEWKAIQEGVINKLFFTQAGTMRKYSEIRRDVDRLLNGENKEIGRRLFDDELQGQLNRFTVLLERMPIPGAAYSPSGNIINAQKLGQSISSLAGSTPVFEGILRGVGNAVSRGLDPRNSPVKPEPVYIASANLRGKVAAALQAGSQQALGSAKEDKELTNGVR